MMPALRGALERMTRREKTLLAAMLAVFLVLSIGIGTAVAIHTLGTLRTEIDELRNALLMVRAKAPAYLAAVGHENALEERIKESKIRSLRIPINDVAKKVPLPAGDGEEEEQTLADVIRFEGKVVETPVLLGSARKRKKARGELKPGQFILQKDQEINVREAPFKALYGLLEELEKSQDLLFATRLEMSRTYNDYEKGRISMVVTTYAWPEGEEK
jgi:hypothetical protein